MSDQGLPKIEGYEIIRLLGEGGFGSVYLAKENSPCRLVAIKLIKENSFHSSKKREKVREQFLKEADALAALQHPNVVTIHVCGETGGEPYLCMEYLEGGSLADHLRVQKQAHTPKEAAQIVRTLASAIHAVHKEQILHRDLKPANVLLAKLEDETVLKIGDFGLARFFDSTSTRLRTSLGEVQGTPAYMSPEQASGAVNNLGPATDVYSLGAILYELLTGRPPYQGPTPHEVLFQVRSGKPEPPRVRRLNRQVPRELEWICLKCLEQKPRDRYGSACELADDLKNYLEHRPVQACPRRLLEPLYRSRKWVRRNPWASVAMALLLLLSIGGSLGTWYFNYLKEQETAARIRETEAKNQEREARIRETEAKNLEKKQRLLSDTRAATIALNQGLNLCDQGRIGEGLTYLVRGLEIAPKDVKDLRTVLQLNIAHWSSILPELKMTFPHDHLVEALAIDEKRKHLITGAEDDAVRIWDLATGKLITAITLAKRPHGIKGLVLTRDGRYLFIAYSDGSIHRWNREEGDQSVELIAPKHTPSRKEHGRRVHPITLSPDDKQLLSGSEEGTVRLYDAATGQLIRSFIGHQGPVGTVAFSPDGRQVVTGSFLDPTVRVWDVEKGTQVLQLPHEQGSVVWTVAYSLPDGRQILTGDFEGQVRFWDAKTGKRLGKPINQGGSAVNLAVHPNGSLLLVSSEKADVQIWSLSSRNPFYPPFVHHPSPTGVMRWHKDGEQFVTASTDGVRLWRMARRRDTVTPLDTRGTLSGFALEAEGRLCAASNLKGEVHVWDISKKTPQVLYSPPRQQSPHFASALTFHPGGRSLAIGYSDGTIRLWDLQKNTVTWTIPASKKAQNFELTVHCLAFDSRGLRWAAGRRDGTIQIGQTDNGHSDKLIHAHQGDVKVVAFSPNGNKILTGGEDFTARLWDVAAGKELAAPLARHGQPVSSVAFAPNGLTALIASMDGVAQVWDLNTHAPLGKRLIYPGFILSAAFHPEGDLVLMGGADCTVRTWYWRTGHPVGPPLEHGYWITQAWIHPDGHKFYLLSGPPGQNNFALYTWTIPTVEKSLPRLQRQIRLATGIEFDSDDSLRALDSNSWKQAWQQQDRPHP